MAINAGVKKIVIGSGYPDQMASEMLQEAKVEVCRAKLPPD